MLRDLSLSIFDIAQNSIAAGATCIEITLEEGGGELRITLRDDGRGVPPQALSRLADPFYTTRTTRKVGLGIPFLKQAAEMTGGGLEVQSSPGKGLALTARFVATHIDMPPLGRVEESVFLLITLNPALDFVYSRRVGGAEFALDTRRLRGILGEGASFSHPEIAAWLRDYLAEQASFLPLGKD